MRLSEVSGKTEEKEEEIWDGSGEGGGGVRDERGVVMGMKMLIEGGGGERLRRREVRGG